MNPAERAVDLIDLVYAAVHNRDGWTDVAKALSELLSGAAVSVIAPTLGSLPSETVFRVGFKDEYNAAVQRFSIDFAANGSRPRYVVDRIAAINLIQYPKPLLGE